jgi:hypothetical protein
MSNKNTDKTTKTSEPKFCAHLKFTDDTVINIPVQILKKIGTKYECKITIFDNPKNHVLTICKNSKIMVEIDAPKRCPEPSCDCGQMSLTLKL